MEDAYAKMTESMTAATAGSGAAQLPAIGTIEVPACGVPVRGEDVSCGDPRVRCGTAEVVLPANALVERVEYHVREAAGGPWATPAGIGWCDWVEHIHDTLPGGRRRVGATLKNWSHNRGRLARVTVHYRLV